MAKQERNLHTLENPIMAWERDTIEFRAWLDALLACEQQRGYERNRERIEELWTAYRISEGLPI